MSHRRAEEPNPKKMKANRIWIACLLGVLAVALALGGIVVYQIVNSPYRLFTPSVDQGLLNLFTRSQTTTPAGSATEQTVQAVVSGNGDKIVNVLLLGIDQDYKTYAKDGGDYHTDAMLVLAINFTQNTVSIISLPRDTITHVPGIRGIYKLNAAINCGGGKTDAGFAKVCETASWLLGGIRVDYYYAFELDTVVEIGDLIGGVDFDLDMSYKGSSGTQYTKGFQHLDGTGIYDYMRARKNATAGEAGDKGRTERQRRMLVALFTKLKSQNMLSQIPGLINAVNHKFYTNVSLAQTAALANFGMNVDPDAIGTYTIGGKMAIQLDGWAFSFPDQENRRQVIHAAYGVEVADLDRVSQAYAEWMIDTGFLSEKFLYNANLILEAAQATQADASACRTACDELKTAYDQASRSLSEADTRAMEKARKALKEAALALADSVEYDKSLSWQISSPWNRDIGINEVTVDFN